MRIGNIFSSIFRSITGFGKRPGNLNMSFRLSVILGKQGLKVKVNSSIRPSGRLGFLKKAIFKLNGSFKSKVDSKLEIYFSELLKLKSKDALSQVQNINTPLYMQMASFTSLFSGIVGNIQNDPMGEIISQLQNLKLNLEAHRSEKEIRIIMKIKAQGSKDLLVKGMEAVKGLSNQDKLVEGKAVPVVPPQPPHLQKAQNWGSMPEPSAPPMTPEMLAEYNAKQGSDEYNYGPPPACGYIPIATPVSPVTEERQVQMDPIQALYFHSEQLQNFLSMFHSRVSYELQPNVERLYKALEELAKGSFNIMYEFKKGQEKVKLKSEDDTRKAIMEISFFDSLREDGDVFSKFMSSTVIPKSMEFLNSGSKDYKVHKQKMDQVLSEITTAYSYQSVVHHLTQARNLFGYFCQNGFPEGTESAYATWQDIDYKISNTLQTLTNLEHLTAQLDEVIGNPDRSIVPHLQEQLKLQLDYLTGVKQYHHTFEETFNQQYQAVAEVVRPDDTSFV
ncbi:hypothetical protein DID80_03250 [Candidatus Marinamargulisbacteria bacterium SCGC AAA071-K20]|nr:hypothetical protein DID80_03250 [Candidatus Marinamargulisbacteria bacterium SCGC AAA071-K20]